MAYSLSYFKKRVAYLNKTYGTSFSPKRLYEIYQRTGRLPESLPDITKLPDPRPHAERVYYAYEGAATTANQSRFYQLGQANRYVGALLWAEGGYISPGGKTVYKQDRDGNWLAWNISRPGSPSAVQAPQKGSVQLTASKTRQLIVSKAEDIHAKTKEHPSRGYTSI